MSVFAFVKRLFRNLIGAAPEAQYRKPVWSVVADVMLEVPFGPGGVEKRSGTKQFAGGTKVYVIVIFWGMGGERVKVVGKPRDSERHISIVVRSNRLANWRVEQVFNSYVIRQIMANCGIRTKVEIEQEAATIAGYNGNPTQPPVEQQEHLAPPAQPPTNGEGGGS